jgi:hypothetical protein
MQRTASCSSVRPRTDCCLRYSRATRDRVASSSSRHVRYASNSDQILRRSEMTRCANSGLTPYLFFSFSLFYGFLCRINTCGNLPPVIPVFDMTVACNRVGRSERHPITFGGLLVIPTGLRHNWVLHLSYRRSVSPTEASCASGHLCCKDFSSRLRQLATSSQHSAAAMSFRLWRGSRSAWANISWARFRHLATPYIASPRLNRRMQYNQVAGASGQKKTLMPKRHRKVRWMSALGH